MAYLMVTGGTQAEALRNAKKVATALRECLPEGAKPYVPRNKGAGDDAHAYEVPVMGGPCFDKAKSVIAKIVLKGSVDKVVLDETFPH